MFALSRRRITQALSAAVLVAVAGIATADTGSPGKSIRVGLLLSGFESTYPLAERAFLEGMREIGYVEGKNFVLERRYAHLQPQRMATVAKELVDLNLDAIVTACTGSTRAVQRATARAPIVMASVADPVGQGFVRALARSGTNVTGRSSQSRELVPKMLELVHAAVPTAQTIAVFVNTLNTAHEPLWQDAVAAAPAQGVRLVRVEVRGPADLDAALDTLATLRVDALVVLPDDPMTHNLRGRLVAVANLRRLPAIFGMREFVADGGLMSYGESFADTYRHAAAHVGKVVRGANPAELPIEQPTQFELVINMKTAAALGLAVPKVLLLRADETIR